MQGKIIDGVYNDDPLFFFDLKIERPILLTNHTLTFEAKYKTQYK